MKILTGTFILVCPILVSCYGVNSRTSEIADLNYTCPREAWNGIKIKYSVTKISDSTFGQQVSGFKMQPFETDLIYFDDAPKEIIGVSTDHYAIRYIYNPIYSRQILDGFSSKLNEREKKRIQNRIYTLLEEFGCRRN